MLSCFFVKMTDALVVLAVNNGWLMPFSRKVAGLEMRNPFAETRAG
jgi:hypothetical protein